MPPSNIFNNTKQISRTSAPSGTCPTRAASSLPPSPSRSNPSALRSLHCWGTPTRGSRPPKPTSCSLPAKCSASSARSTRRNATQPRKSRDAHLVATRYEGGPNPPLRRLRRPQRRWSILHWVRARRGPAPPPRFARPRHVRRAGGGHARPGGRGLGAQREEPATRLGARHTLLRHRLHPQPREPHRLRGAAHAALQVCGALLRLLG
jgi:hypothetical protein|uniref:Uncharacterized protein n=1 Tax=Zea mays TaxID=4577 RepID=B4FPK7_MAIZE|nr:unknown [Zea mays]ACN26435.1 unknown [Zea mays]ACN27430.1 unknown [Zea mays]